MSLTDAGHVAFLYGRGHGPQMSQSYPKCHLLKTMWTVMDVQLIECKSCHFSSLCNRERPPFMSPRDRTEYHNAKVHVGGNHGSKDCNCLCLVTNQALIGQRLMLPLLYQCSRPMFNSNTISRLAQDTYPYKGIGIFNGHNIAPYQFARRTQRRLYLMTSLTETFREGVKEGV